MGQAYNCFTSELVHNECDALMVVSGCVVEHGVKHICTSSRMPHLLSVLHIFNIFLVVIGLI